MPKTYAYILPGPKSAHILRCAYILLFGCRLTIKGTGKQSEVRVQSPQHRRRTAEERGRKAEHRLGAKKRVYLKVRIYPVIWIPTDDEQVKGNCPACTELLSLEPRGPKGGFALICRPCYDGRM
jgi:hypothetical protein